MLTLWGGTVAFGLIGLEWMFMNPGGRREKMKRSDSGGSSFIGVELFIAARLCHNELSLMLQCQKDLTAGNDQQYQAAVLIDGTVFYSHGLIIDNSHEKIASKPRAKEI